MFKSQNFCHIASNNRNQIKVGVFIYRTTDNLATVSASGYFNGRIIDINLHDLIIHEQIDATDPTKIVRNLLCVTERTLENVGTTLIKSDWENGVDLSIADLYYKIEHLDLSDYVKKDGSTIMSAPLKFSAGSMRGAVGPYLNGVSFWKLDSQGNITNIANLTDSQFTPVTSNSISLGNTTHTWKDAYIARVITSVINNGYDIAVPVTNSADTLALKSQVDDAANSGEQLYTTGVWYAKMYSATVVPTGAEYDGRNYADFSQVDNDNNPIIVIYTGASGAWTETTRITPPVNHNGYITVTSKIWDIAEQSGQQGGQVLWSWNNKTFTPYPRIVSFDSINITGNSTVVMPLSLTDDSIVNKKYVDDATSGSGYHPDLFDWKWADHQLNDVQWLRADTYSWQDSGVYEAAYNHLVEDVEEIIPAWTWLASGVGSVYTAHRNPAVGDKAYSDTDLTVEAGDITEVTSGSITVNSTVYNMNGHITGNISTETVAGITINYYQSSDGHKIIQYNQITQAEQIYAATGSSWYYILDYMNQRFKLPRAKPLTGGVLGNGMTLGLTNGTLNGGLQTWNSNALCVYTETYGVAVNTQDNSGGTLINDSDYRSIGLAEDATKSGIIAERDSTDQHKYLYFYVGEFTQSAIENTAGLNADLFNGKVDVGHQVIAFQAPSAGNNYTWYRLYADGWVEQGGIYNSSNLTYPVTMDNTYYTLFLQPLNTSNKYAMNAQNITTTGATIDTEASQWHDYSWQVSGIAA